MTTVTAPAPATRRKNDRTGSAEAHDIRHVVGIGAPTRQPSGISQGSEAAADIRSRRSSAAAASM